MLMLEYYLLGGVGVALLLVFLLWLSTRDKPAPTAPVAANTATLAEPDTPTVIEPAKLAAGDIDIEVRMLIDYGNKAAAIRVVREKLGLDLKDAKELVDAMARGAPIPIRDSNAAPNPSDAADQEVRKLVSAGRLIDAMQLVREQKGLALSEAKAYVERL